MIIAVNAGFSFKNQNKAYKDFIDKCFYKITTKHIQHKFIFISDEPFDTHFALFENSISAVVSYKLIHRPLKKILLKKKVCSLLKKYSADVFITDDQIFISAINIPQCIIILHSNESHQFNIKYLSKAKVICTNSEFEKGKIIEQYKIDLDKIHNVYTGIDDIFQPVNLKEKEVIKDQYADGKEYFLCPGSIDSKDNLINLLKAFSVFKRRQKSNMQLVIAGKILLSKKELSDNLRSYKYKDEVKTFDTSENELVRIISSAYAVVSPFYIEGVYLPVLQILKCEVPVIANNNGVIPEAFADAVLYAESKDYNDIADKMMLIFKDERLRHQLIEKSKLLTLHYTWEKTSGLLWNAMQQMNYNPNI